jgi:hypothetical protein
VFVDDTVPITPETCTPRTTAVLVVHLYRQFPGMNVGGHTQIVELHLEVRDIFALPRERKRAAGASAPVISRTSAAVHERRVAMTTAMGRALPTMMLRRTRAVLMKAPGAQRR